MARTSYSDKLKDPRWQRKRLEILKRDNWECQWCGDDKSCLHVHHLIYQAGHEPWDYADDELLTVCETCHEAEKERRQAAARLLYAFSVRWKLNTKTLNDLAAHFEGMAKAGVDDPVYVFMNLDANGVAQINRAAEEILTNTYSAQAGQHG